MEKEKKKISLKEIGPTRLVILLMVGIFLLLLSFPDLMSSDKAAKNSVQSVDSEVKQNLSTIQTGDEAEIYVSDLEKRLENTLAKVEGIGTVEVMITLKGSKEIVVLKDEPYTQESVNEVDGEGGTRNSSSIDKQDSTVLIDSGSGESIPYILKEIEPEVEGVVVIAEGGGNILVITEIIEALQVLFDVPAHKVKVMKMN
ncbi:MAG: stage III sporulation protein AG [Anaerocolumna sp.]